MDKNESFVTKLDVVFDRILNRKLRKDLDDSLLEKLLGVIKGGLPNNDLMVIMKKTKFLVLFDQTINSMQGSERKMDSNIETFVLHLVGIFLGDENMFLNCNENQRLLHSITDICKINSVSPYSPSIQAAILSCLNSIATHFSGLVWLIENGMTDVAFTSFSGSSYYVRKDAVNFLTTLLITWSSSEVTINKYSNKKILDSDIKKCIGQLISNLDLSNCWDKSSSVRECSISVLKTSMAKCKTIFSLLCKDFQLSDEIYKVLTSTKLECELPDSIIELFVESHLYCQSETNTINNIIQQFCKHGFVAPVLVLLTAFLSKQPELSLSSNEYHLGLVLCPTVIISDMSISCVLSEEFKHFLTNKMSDKSSCIQLLRISLIALSKLVHLMDAKTVSCVGNVAAKVLSSTQTTQLNSTLQFNIAGCKKVQLSVLQLFSSLFDEKVHLKLNNDVNALLLESLISTLENPTSDNNLTSQALKLAHRQIGLLPDWHNVMTRELMERLVEIVQRKLLDPRWPVVDSSLEVVEQFVKVYKDDKVWLELICDLGIITAVWDIAISSNAEGYVRATALRTLMSICHCPFTWEQLQSQREADEDTILSVLCNLANDHDIFVQRESISSLFQWMQTNNIGISSKNSTFIFKTLTQAAKCSLDWDTKLIALQAWQWVAKKELSQCVSSTQDDVKKVVCMLCETGYGLSILSALTDHDRTVQQKAVEELLSLRQMLQSVGLNQTTFPCEVGGSSNSSSVNYINSEASKQDLSEPSIKTVLSKEQRDAAISDVLDLDTFGQICNILRKDFPDSLQLHSQLNQKLFGSLNLDAQSVVSCSLQNFLKKLWSNEIDPLLTLSSKSSDVYVNDPIALLDDIIAASINIDVFDVEYQDADCY